MSEQIVSTSASTSKGEHPTSATQPSTSISVTSNVKEKNPKRVAAGKRLGMISKKAKEAKREAQRLEQRQQLESDNNHTLYVLGGLVVTGTVAYYLYLNKNKKKSENP